STTGRAVNYGRTRARRRRDSLLPEVEELFDLVQNEEDQRALLDHDVGLRGHAELDDADLMPVVLELELRERDGDLVDGTVRRRTGGRIGRHLHGVGRDLDDLALERAVLLVRERREAQLRRTPDVDVAAVGVADVGLEHELAARGRDLRDRRALGDDRALEGDREARHEPRGRRSQLEARQLLLDERELLPEAAHLAVDLRLARRILRVLHVVRRAPRVALGERLVARVLRDLDLRLVGLAGDLRDLDVAPLGLDLRLEPA